MLHRRAIAVRETWRGLHDEKALRLGRNPIFRRLSIGQLSLLAAMVDDVWVTPGTTLAKQGTRAIETFVIDSGLAAVELDGIQIGEIDARQTLAIMARATETPLGATVRALTRMHLYVIEPQRLRPFLSLVPWSIEAEWSDAFPRAIAFPVAA